MFRSSYAYAIYNDHNRNVIRLYRKAQSKSPAKNPDMTSYQRFFQNWKKRYLSSDGFCKNENVTVQEIEKAIPNIPITTLPFPTKNAPNIRSLGILNTTATASILKVFPQIRASNEEITKLKEQALKNAKEKMRIAASEKGGTNITNFKAELDTHYRCASVTAICSTTAELLSVEAADDREYLPWDNKLTGL